MVLEPLANIFHHQHIFTLIFVVVHQPVAQPFGLFIIGMAGDGACQRFRAQQLAASAPQALGGRAEKRVAGIEHHAEMVAVQVQGAAGSHQCDRVNRVLKLQVGCPGEHHLFKITASDGLGCLADKAQPFGLFRMMLFLHNLNGQWTNGSRLTELLEKIQRGAGIIVK